MFPLNREKGNIAMNFETIKKYGWPIVLMAAVAFGYYLNYQGKTSLVLIAAVAISTFEFIQFLKRWYARRKAIKQRLREAGKDWPVY